MSSQARPKQVEVPIESPIDDPENWIYNRRSNGEVEYYLPYLGDHEAAGKHILRGSCDATVEGEDGERKCGDNAAVRRINDSGIEEYCLRDGHAPEAWIAALDGHGQIDDTLVDLRRECEKQVVNHNVSGLTQLDTSYTPGDDRDRIRRDPAVHECGDRAFVLMTDSDSWSKAFCRQHARQSWLADLRLPTGDPTNGSEYPGQGERPGWPDDVSRDECVWVDAPSGEGYSSHRAWSDGVSGEYPDVNTAEKHLVVLKGPGKHVLY